MIRVLGCSGSIAARCHTTSFLLDDDILIDAGTGVAECDQYLEKVYACISDKVPEAQRDMMKQGIEQSKASWSAVTDKTALAAQCKTAMEQAKTAYAAMGCSF